MMSLKGKQKTRERMIINNPMKREEVRIKSSISHKGDTPWNRGLCGEEYLKHFPNGVKGGRAAGYKHTIESRIKMSLNTKGKKHPNYKISFEKRKEYAERMKKNRKDFEFNFKMFKSLQKSRTKPHNKVLEYIKSKNSISTISNYPCLIGNRYAEIDEADIQNKIAIFIDGNYWHNYPNLRRWDKQVNTYLERKGWKVYRFWESDINNNFEHIKLVIDSIKACPLAISNLTK